MFERLAEADRAFIKHMVSEGLYGSEIEVVRDAVRRLREQQLKQSRLSVSAVMNGEQAIKEGRCREWTPEVMHELIKQGVSRAKAQEPYYSTDAIPPDET